RLLRAGGGIVVSGRVRSVHFGGPAPGRAAANTATGSCQRPVRALRARHRCQAGAHLLGERGHPPRTEVDVQVQLLSRRGSVPCRDTHNS
ncbi:hypothetical protein, partial [Rhodococcus sp. NPDC059234]|uniref:hypothetical protein n=1 Tax=Rhodococcus sp. NPDC059234 TaxID=3346781 RepID=UPI003671EE21